MPPLYMLAIVLGILLYFIIGVALESLALKYGVLDEKDYTVYLTWPFLLLLFTLFAIFSVGGLLYYYTKVALTKTFGAKK